MTLVSYDSGQLPAVGHFRQPATPEEASSITYLTQAFWCLSR